MAILVADCPHCSSSKVTFEVFGAKAVDLGRARAAHRIDGADALITASAGAECRKCGLPISAELISTATKDTWPDFPNRVASLAQSSADVTVHDFHVGRIWPQPEPLRIPEHLPPSVERAFRQGEKNYSQEDCEDAAATMYRKALEAGLRHLHPDAKGSLAKRIKDLVQANELPAAIGDWCDEVRLIGNDGAHDDEGVSCPELTEARDFVDATLRYLFSLPAMISRRRSHQSAPHD